MKLMLYGNKKTDPAKTKMTIDDISLVLSKASYPDLLHFANVFKESLRDAENSRIQDISAHDWAHAFYTFATEYHNSEERTVSDPVVGHAISPPVSFREND